jgi:hypothetical protein
MGFAALAVALLVACGGTGSSGTPVPVSPGTSPNAIAAGTNGLPPEVPLAKLVRKPTDYDGQTLLVTGASYFASNGQQLLCDTFLESYPPQPAGNQLGLVGQLPDIVLAQLQSTGGDPSVAQVLWGQVSVIGIVHAGAAASSAWLEMQSIRVELGQSEK